MIEYERLRGKRRRREVSGRGNIRTAMLSHKGMESIHFLIPKSVFRKVRTRIRETDSDFGVSAAVRREKQTAAKSPSAR